MTPDVSPIRYRQAQRSDIPDMARIWGIEKGEGGTSEERMMAYFDGQLHPQHALLPRVIYVAHEGDSLIGYIAGHLTRRFACDGELEWIYVHPQRRRSGTGSDLLLRLKEWFKEQHAPKVCVNVAPDNSAAIEFYTRHGAAKMNQHWLVWSDFARAIEESGRAHTQAPRKSHKGQPS
jgi:ribosomal protein S18 acetylase RimI-like enzyme